MNPLLLYLLYQYIRIRSAIVFVLALFLPEKYFEPANSVLYAGDTLISRRINTIVKTFNYSAKIAIRWFHAFCAIHNLDKLYFAGKNGKKIIQLTDPVDFDDSDSE